MRRLTLCLLPVAVAACARTPPLETSSILRTVPAETAFAIPAPGGPAITAVVERRYANATQQEILLSTSAHTSGPNLLRVQLFGPVDGAAAGQGRLREGYLPVTDVGSEMRKLIPGVAMQRSGDYLQNRYGPFGYAVGRSRSGDSCFYGWQGISSTGITQTLIGNKGSIQIRLRLCSAAASEGELLRQMYGFSINAFFKDQGWNPYGEPASPSETLGRPGQPIYPPGPAAVGSADGAFSATGGPAPHNPRRPRAPAVVGPPALPDPIGPVVPSPPGAAGHAEAVVAPRAGGDSGGVSPLQPTVQPDPARYSAEPPPISAEPAAASIVPPPPCVAGAAAANIQCR